MPKTDALCRFFALGSRARPTTPASSPPTNAPKTQSGLSGAMRRSVTATRSFAFLGMARREGIRMLLQAAQPQRAIGRGVGRHEPPDRGLR